jgi:hypothetical protein
VIWLVAGGGVLVALLVVCSLALAFVSLRALSALEPEVVEELVEPPLEPWRDGLHGSATPVAIDALLEVADPVKLENIRRWERDYTAEIGAKIENEGLREPLVLLVDRKGRVCLWDGHHRLVIGVDQEWEKAPVRIETTDMNRGYGKPVAEVLSALLAGAQS